MSCNYGCIDAGVTPEERSTGSDCWNNSVINIRTEEDKRTLAVEFRLASNTTFQKEQGEKKKMQITLGISLQLSLKPVPHYHASVICIA